MIRICLRRPVPAVDRISDRHNPGKLVELANLLGHESLDTTAIYTQPSGEELAEDLERSRLNVYG